MIEFLNEIQLAIKHSEKKLSAKTMRSMKSELLINH